MDVDVLLPLHCTTGISFQHLNTCGDIKVMYDETYNAGNIKSK